MHPHTWPAAALALLVTLGTASSQPPVPAEGVKALDGEWVYVEDRTEGVAKEQQGPNTGPRIKLRVEKDAVVLVRTSGEIRMALDGSPTEVPSPFGGSRYQGEWKDGAYVYKSVPAGKDGGRVIQWTMRVTADGMLVGVTVDPPKGKETVCLFRHPKDIEMPKAAKAVIGDLDWLAGTWVGSRGDKGATTLEERWIPPLGGAMLATARTVSKGRMVAFEYLRIIEQDGGLIYVAQPGGRTGTPFLLTELSKTKAVFENPRHDSPQRIVYEVSAEGVLTTSIGYMKGGKPTRFEYKREGGK